MSACSTPLAPLKGARITTVEGVADGDHICRCTGYIRYYEALKSVATKMLEAKP